MPAQLYGIFGTIVVTLGWFFILGRAIIIAMELNAAIYDRFGGISQVMFSLPVLRTLARRSPGSAGFSASPTHLTKGRVGNGVSGTDR